jgi:MFS transporter, OFA family, oxalate/formate antiporter
MRMRTITVKNSGAHGRAAAGVVIAGFLIQMVTWGGFYSFGVFLLPVAEALDRPRGEVSAAYSVTSFVFGIGSVVSGWLVDRYGPRRVIAVCCTVGAAGFALMSLATESWHAVVALGILGGIGLTGSYVPVTSTVARWFDARRGTMLGIVIAGNAVGGLLGPMLATAAIAGQGWRGAYVSMGIVLGVVALAGAVFLNHPPGGNSGEPAADAAAVGGAGSLRQMGFILLCVAWAVHGLVGTGFLAHYLPHMLGRGIESGAAPLILSVAGGLGIVGGAVGGVVGDRLGSVRALCGGLALLAGAFALLLLADGAGAFWLVSVLFGLGWFGVGVLVPLVATQLVPANQLGKALGLLELVWAVGAGVGAALLGWVFDLTASYFLGWAVLLGTLVVGLAAASRVSGRPGRAVRQRADADARV